MGAFALKTMYFSSKINLAGILLKHMPFFYIALAFFLMMTTPVDAVENRVGIAAVVNDDVVTFSDVRNRVKLYAAGAPQAPSKSELAQMEQQVLNKLIDEKLQLQEAKSLGIVVTEQQIEAGFSDIANQNGIDAAEFRRRLQSSGVKISSLQDQIRAELAWAQVVRRKLRPQVNISETEIDIEMDTRSKQAGAARYLVAEIFLPVDADTNDKRVADDAQKMVEQIRKGARFSELARNFSQSPGASTGGDIGWVQEGQIDAALFTALTRMQPGQLSSPVRTDKGYHILFLRDARATLIPVVAIPVALIGTLALIPQIGRASCRERV